MTRFSLALRYHARPPGGPPRTATVNGCERQIERARCRDGGQRSPVLAIVAASFTAGVGPDNPARSWAVQLARMLHRDAVVW